MTFTAVLVLVAMVSFLSGRCGSGPPPSANAALQERVEAPVEKHGWYCQLNGNGVCCSLPDGLLVDSIVSTVPDAFI